MQKWHYLVLIKDLSEPISIKEYLKKHLLIPKHFIYPLRREKRVLVNQKYITMNSLVNNGDEIELTFIKDDFTLPVQNLIADDSHSIDVLYEDDDILVVNKPAGYKTHPNQPGEVNTVLNFCEAYLNEKNQHAYMIHRLDQQTSGALIVGKNPVVVPILVRLIKDKVINRIYTAVVNGQFKQLNGVIESPIGLDPDDKRKRKIDGINPLSAKTAYRVLSTTEQHSIVQLKLFTGRTHQLRVHLASINHPIVGDPLYGQNLNNQQMLLHSTQLHLVRPFYFDTININAPLPNQFNQYT